MNKRPKSVTVISWILIVTSFISLVIIFWGEEILGTSKTIATFMVECGFFGSSQTITQYLRPVIIASLYLSPFITLVSGAGMLQAQNWARFLYVRMECGWFYDQHIDFSH